MSLGEPLYRVETGNYEYRLVLRCRADAKRRFARMRSDVLTKLELLDNKHVQDIVFQLKRLMSGLTKFHKESQELMSADAKMFPVEIDFEQSTCKPTTNEVDHHNDEYEGEEDNNMDKLVHDNVLDENPVEVPQAGEGNLLEIGDGNDAVEHQNELTMPTANGAIDLLGTSGEEKQDIVGGGMDLLGASGGEKQDTAVTDSSGTWDKNWLLGPNHEESIPKNTEPGGDIDLLLLDN